jgi:hypothetical protein
MFIFPKSSRVLLAAVALAISFYSCAKKEKSSAEIPRQEPVAQVSQETQPSATEIPAHASVAEVVEEKETIPSLPINQAPCLSRSQLIGNWVEQYKESNGSDHTDNRTFYASGTFKSNQIANFTWTDVPVRISWAGKWVLVKNVIKLSDVYVNREYRPEYNDSRFVAVFQNNRWMLFEFGSDMSSQYDPEKRMAGLRTDDPQILEAIKNGKFWIKQ